MPAAGPGGSRDGLAGPRPTLRWPGRRAAARSLLHPSLVPAPTVRAIEPTYDSYLVGCSSLSASRLLECLPHNHDLITGLQGCHRGVVETPQRFVADHGDHPLASHLIG